MFDRGAFTSSGPSTIYRSIKTTRNHFVEVVRAVTAGLNSLQDSHKLSYLIRIQGRYAVYRGVTLTCFGLVAVNALPIRVLSVLPET